MPTRNKEHRREYLRKYQNLWMAKRRQEFFCGKCCAQCGSIDRLELDHIDPKLKIEHKIWSWCKEKRDEEIKKCQVLCFYCHLNKTKKELRKLSNDEVISLRWLASLGYPHRILGKIFGLSKQTAGEIVRKNTYKDSYCFPVETGARF